MNVPGALAAAAVGFVGLTLGAELLVRGGAAAARTLGLSTMAIGLTIVAYGTSAPELAASFIAALEGHTDVTLGNVVGSNIANVGLILGVTALVRPFGVHMRSLGKELTFLMAITVLFAALSWKGGFGRVEGFILLAVLAGFNLLSLKWARGESPQVVKEVAAFEWELTERPGAPLVRDLALLAAGLLLLAAGGHFLIRGAVVLARAAGLSETVIGLTLVAVGTSLPELATSVIAVLRGEVAISIGNLVGSNLFNILGATGISAAARPLIVPEGMIRFEMPALIIFTAAMAFLLGRGRQVGRRHGLLLLAGYAAFIAAVFVRGLF